MDAALLATYVDMACIVFVLHRLDFIGVVVSGELGLGSGVEKWEGFGVTTNRFGCMDPCWQFEAFARCEWVVTSLVGFWYRYVNLRVLGKWVLLWMRDLIYDQANILEAKYDRSRRSTCSAM